MPGRSLESKIARLQREIELLSAQHAEKMAHLPSSTSPKIRQLHTKRAEMLARRIKRMDEMLDELRSRQPESD